MALAAEDVVRERSNEEKRGNWRGETIANYSPDYIIDAAFQGLAYYTMSSLTNDTFKLARIAGFYKGIQSAGSAVSFGMDAVKVSSPTIIARQRSVAIQSSNC